MNRNAIVIGLLLTGCAAPTAGFRPLLLDRSSSKSGHFPNIGRETVDGGKNFVLPPLSQKGENLFHEYVGFGPLDTELKRILVSAISDAAETSPHKYRGPSYDVLVGHIKRNLGISVLPPFSNSKTAPGLENANKPMEIAVSHASYLEVKTLLQKVQNEAGTRFEAVIPWQLPPDATNFCWRLQSSTNLADWVDLPDPCLTDPVSVTASNSFLFYRLKGIQ